MNLKNLEGKTVAQQKNLYEIELIADYEMEYGDEANWSDETIDVFNEEWDKIQERFKNGKE
jgi:hypothetical protein